MTRLNQQKHHIKISNKLSEGGALKTSNIYNIIYVKKYKINDYPKSIKTSHKNIPKNWAKVGHTKRHKASAVYMKWTSAYS